TSSQRFVKPAKAKLRGGVATRPESQPGIKYQVDRPGIGYRVPTGNDPQAGRYPDRGELRLRSANPILLFHLGNAIAGRTGEPDRVCRCLYRGSDVDIIVE